MQGLPSCRLCPNAIMARPCDRVVQVDIYYSAVVSVEGVKASSPTGVPLSTEERAAVIRRCQAEWKAILDNDPHLAEQYSTIGSCNRIQKIATARAEEAETGPDEPFVGLWGLSRDPELVLPPSVMNACPRGDQHINADSLPHHPPQETVHARFGSLPRMPQLVTGCHAKGNTSVAIT